MAISVPEMIFAIFFFIKKLIRMIVMLNWCWLDNSWNSTKNSNYPHRFCLHSTWRGKIVHTFNVRQLAVVCVSDLNIEYCWYLVWANIVFVYTWMVNSFVFVTLSTSHSLALCLSYQYEAVYFRFFVFFLSFVRFFK